MDTKHIRNLIARNKIEDALNLLRAINIDDIDLSNSFDALSGEYVSLKNRKLVTNEIIEPEINRFRLNLLNLISDLEISQKENKRHIHFSTNQKRAIHLKKKLEDTTELISEWEEKRDLAENPTEEKRCEKEINKLNRIFKIYSEEYNLLLNQ